MKNTPCLSVALLLAIATACGDSSGPSGSAAGAMSATIDGAAWSSDPSLVLADDFTGGVPGAIAFSGTSEAASRFLMVRIALGYVDGPGQYPLGVDEYTTLGGTASISDFTETDFLFWTTDLSGAAGRVTITSLAGGRVRGTFNFTARELFAGAAAPVRVVANGSFDAPIPRSYSPPSAANRGNRMSARIFNVNWNAALVSGSATGGSIALAGESSTYAVHMSSTVPVEAGHAYPLGSSTGFQITVQDGSGLTWGGTGNDAGTVTISSLSDGRAVGTFSATLARAGAGGPALSITSGSFDVRVGA